MNCHLSLDNIDYWDLVAIANIKLCLLLLNHKTKADVMMTYEDVLKAYKITWDRAGSRGKKVAEMEHLEFIADTLSILDPKKNATAAENIDLLKTTLTRMI